MGHALSRAWNNLKHQIYCWVHSHCYISRLVVTDDTTLRNLLRPAAAVNAINSTLNGTNFPRPADTANHTNGTIYDTAGSGHHLLAKRAALMNLLEPGVAHSGMASEYGWLWIALFLVSLFLPQPRRVVSIRGSKGKADVMTRRSSSWVSSPSSSAE